MPLHDRLALGSWVDPLDSSHPNAAASMPVRYADESVKLLSQQRVKLQVLKAVRQGLACAQGDAHALSWPQLLQSSLPRLVDEVRPAVAVESADPCPEVVPSEHQPGPEISSSSSSISLSSSSSSSSAEDDVDLATFEWVVPQHPGGKIHRAHPTKVSREGCARPACCAISGAPHSGTGAFAVMAEFPQRKWCERCAADICLRLTSTA